MELFIRGRDLSNPARARELLALFQQAVLDTQADEVRRPYIRLSFGGTTLEFIGDFKMDVKDTAGPFDCDIVNFVDSKGNPTTEHDVPVWNVEDPAIATLVVTPDNAQEATVTLTGTLGQTQVTATFGDPLAGGFVVTGVLNVLPSAAVSASMTIVDVNPTP